MIAIDIRHAYPLAGLRGDPAVPPVALGAGSGSDRAQGVPARNPRMSGMAAGSWRTKRWPPS